VKYFKPLQVAPQHIGSLNKIRFSPDGTKAVLIARNKPLRLWDIKLPDVKIMECSDAFGFAQFSADGNMIMSCSRDGTIQFWDVESCKVIKKCKHPGNVYGYQFSSDGKILASYSFNSVFRIWDVQSGQEIQVSNYNGIECICFSLDDQYIAIVQVGVIEIWNAVTGKQMRKFQAHYIKNMQFSSDSQLLASPSLDGTMRIWDVKSGNEVQTLEYSFGFVTGLEFFPDNKTIITSYLSPIRLWNLRLQMEIQELKGHQNDVIALHVLPDGNTFISGDLDGIIRLWTAL
ncbi:G-protein beta WD-40 repeats containing protein, partial [Reticulomyxa filosa]